MHNGNKKNNEEKNLIKYSLSLLVVAMVFIAIGGISLSRSINRGDERVMKNFNVNDKIKQISEENLNLTRENKSLRVEIEETKKSHEAEKTILKNRIQAYELYVKAQGFKEEEPEKYEKIMEQIKTLEINEKLKERLTKQQEGEK